MTDCKPGDVVLVPFPFTDLETNKQRPALVLESIESKNLPSLILVAMITSQIDSEKILGDHLLKDWQSCGLLHPSKLRLAKMVTLEGKMILKKLGRLTRGEEERLRRSFQKLFSYWRI